jgi:hypothetical protein
MRFNPRQYGPPTQRTAVSAHKNSHHPMRTSQFVATTKSVSRDATNSEKYYFREARDTTLAKPT